MSCVQYKWIIAICCYWINLFIFGVFRSAGVLYIELISTFESTYQQASWPISLAGSVASITGIAAGFLSHYFHVRTLVCVGVLICSFSTSICYFATNIWFIIVSLGIIQGIGIGLVINLLPSIISEYFSKQRAIAVGFSFAGATTGALMFPFLIEWLFDMFALNSTLLIMGAITLHALIGALLLRPYMHNTANSKPSNNCDNCDESNNRLLGNQSNDITYVRTYSEDDEDVCKFIETGIIANISKTETTTTDNSKQSSIFSHISNDSKLFLDCYFELCAITYITFVINFMAFIIVIPDYALESGLTATQSTSLLSIFSMFDLFGRLIPGWISFFEFLSNKSIYILTIAVMGIAFLLMPIFATTFLTILAFTMVCGFVCGCQMVLAPVVLSEHFGAERTAVAFGLSNFMCGIVTIITKPFMFALRDLTGNYVALFVTMGVLAVISALLWLIREIRSYFTNR